MTQLTTLANGVRIASVEMPQMKTVSVGIWAAVGGRHEPPELCGVSHFLEHLMFKGTRKRSARKITEAVEGVGGYLNAFTTEDHTCYYAKAGARHLPVLCDVLSDMILHSRFAPAEIERERDVIREEILMVHDNPGQYIEELLSEVLWPGHPLGRPLTGTAESIAGLSREKCFAFKESHYTGRTILVTVAGAATHDRVLELMAPALEALPAGCVPPFEKSNHEGSVKRPWIKTVKEEIEQTHLALGFHAFGRLDERRFALKLLSVILGENMSSRLFQKLRERHGFCYSIQSSVVALEDTGALTFFAAIEPAKVQKSLRLIMEELERIAERPPRPGEVRKARDYTLGQTLMGLESTSGQMTWMGESLLSHGRVVPPREVEEKLLAVTPEEIRAVAAACLVSSKLGVAVAGPELAAEKIQAWLAR